MQVKDWKFACKLFPRGNLSPLLLLPYSRFPNQAHLDVHFEGERLALDQAKLSQVIAVVRGVKDEGVVQLAQSSQFLVEL